jgi:hypothetical protein
MSRSIEQIAADVLRCVTSGDTEARLIGDIRATELARLAASHITSCPSCGAEPWVNIDCSLCVAMTALEASS